jgi:hypothetical protein
MLIAHVSIRKMLPFLVFVLFVLFADFGLVVLSYLKYSGLRPVPIFVLGLGSLIAIAAVSTIMQIATHHGRGLWIDSGNLIYLSRFVLVIDCQAIREFSAGVGKFERPQIFVELVDGSKRAIPIQGLREPADVIISRLNSAVLENRARNWA